MKPSLRSLGLFFCLGMLGISAPIHARTITVPDDYWAISIALRQAHSGDVVRVRPGTYTEWAMFLKNGVTLQGLTDDPGTVVIQGDGQSRVLLIADVDTTVTVADLTIAGGNADGETFSNGSGGGMLIDNAQVVLTRVYFDDNQARFSGGALRVMGSSPVLEGCVFTDNRAGSGGGAIDCSYDSSPEIRECEFRNNSAGWGGGISVRGESLPTISNCVFFDNQTLGEPGLGAGIFADIDSKPNVTGCTFAWNKARYGGACAAGTGANVQITSCTLRENRSVVAGGGIYLKGCTPIVDHSIIAFNSGAAVHSRDGSVPRLSACDLSGNTDGDWVGIIANQAVQRDNLAADPLFCSDVDHHLDTASPCAPPNSPVGLIGALEAGCTGEIHSEDSLETAAARIVVAPNPCNPLTTISFDLDIARHVRLQVYDVKGDRVRVLQNGWLAPGPHAIDWDGLDASGRLMASGTYIVAFAADGLGMVNTKVLLVR